MKQENSNSYLADNGKVFQNKDTKEIYGYGICLAEGDSIDNYIEIDNPDPNNPEYTPHENDNITKGKHK